MEAWSRQLFVRFPCNRKTTDEVSLAPRTECDLILSPSLQPPCNYSGETCQLFNIDMHWHAIRCNNLPALKSLSGDLTAHA